MPDADELLSTGWPRWLVAVAVRVDELVAAPHALDRFWRMLRDWKAAHDAREPSSPVGKRGQIGHNPIEILPVRRLTLPDKYAALAAIHDVVCEGTKRIDPWRIRQRHRNFARSKSGISYAVLCGRIEDLRDTDRDRIEDTLRDVEADLAAPSAEPTPAVDAPEKSLIDRLAEIAEPPTLSGDVSVTPIDDDSHLSTGRLAEIFRVPANALRIRLNRWRAKNDTGWIENPDRRPREAKYLYRVGSVRHVIDALKATSETTSETTSERSAKSKKGQ